MNSSQKTTLKVLILPLIIGIVVVQTMIDPISAEIHAGEKSSIIGMSNEFILGPALGLQQAVAGALWVRADEFFHEGDYDAILPIVRMVTWLDPHQLDVYITGGWHLAYNFTDSNERSDRRYIPAAQKLLEEGDANNSSVYDIAFELGWQNVDKIKNYPRATYWFKTAGGPKRTGTDRNGKPGKHPPAFVYHQIAHSLEREGKIDECIEQWRQCLAESDANIREKKSDLDAYSLNNVRQSEVHNLELTLKRRYSRCTHEIDFDVDAKQTRSVNRNTGEPSPNTSYVATRKEDGVPYGTPRLPATARLWDVAFEGRAKFSQPMVMDPSGDFNIADGARVTIRLHDEDWHEKQLKEFKFDIDQTQTIMIDQHSVRQTTWGRKIDMSKDPKMYSFSRDYYYLVFEFNPRGTSPFIQDKIGWSGEGMTDKKYLWIDNSTNPPIRWIRKVFKISKQQILGQKPVTDADVISNDEYARIQAAAETKKTASAQ